MTRLRNPASRGMPSGSPVAGPGKPPPPGAGRRTRRRSTGGSFIGTYGLLVLTVAVFALFAVLLPDTFPTGNNFRAILTNQSIPAILALAVAIPIVTGRFDLSIGFGIGLAHVVAMWLLVHTGVPWPLVIAILLAGGLLVGLTNGFLVELARIDSLIATLGTGSILYAFTGWITGRIVPGPGGLPPAFTDLSNSSLLGLPVTAWYVLALVLVLWLVLEHLPLGRHLYVVGANPRAADLVGIRRRRVVISAFVGSSVVTAFAGALLAAQQQIGDPSAGNSYLLPAFVGALLGSTTIRPGRANAFGTLIAVAVLAIGLSGLQQLGAAFWITPLFNGLTLLTAVGFAGLAARRRQRAAAVVGVGRQPPAGPPRPSTSDDALSAGRHTAVDETRPTPSKEN
jgi:ribose transport system permease protein